MGVHHCPDPDWFRSWRICGSLFPKYRRVRCLASARTGCRTLRACCQGPAAWSRLTTHSRARASLAPNSSWVTALSHKVLFICGKNRLRSPTAEHVFADWPGIETSSAGISADSDNPVTPELLQWADTIFCMERSHHSRLSSRFKPHLGRAKMVCLNIPDKFKFMAPELVALLHAKVPPHLPGALRRGQSGVH